MWFGPANKRPFNRNRFHFTFNGSGIMPEALRPLGSAFARFCNLRMDVTAPNPLAMGGNTAILMMHAKIDTLQAIYELTDSTYYGIMPLVSMTEHTANHGLGFVGRMEPGY